MDLPEKAPTAITHSNEVSALLPEAVRILQRDFDLSNNSCDLHGFDGDVFLLRERLIPSIERTGGPGSEAFYRLLYRADIPEKQVTEALQATTDQPIMSRISELLIIRALQKAWYRAKFS